MKTTKVIMYECPYCNHLMHDTDYLQCPDCVQHISHPNPIPEITEDVKIHLTQFLDFLLKEGYCDTDVYAEPPTAIDQYLTKIKLMEEKR